jgi:Glycosyl transferases group 1/Glycosyltransferase Family 4
VFVLHVDSGREMRGGQHQVLLLMEGLRRAGHISELLARPAGPLWNAAREADFPVFAARLQTLRARSRKADLVHVHDAHSHSLAALVCKSFVVSRRVAFPVQQHLVSLWKYRRARRFLAVSNFVAAELERAGIAKEKIDIVYDGVELTSNPSFQPKDDFRVVALDLRDPKKGRDLAEQAANLAGIPILFTDDLTRDLHYASAFLYLTRSEGLGSGALVAMSLGVPVIASRVGGLPEVVIHEESGLLVENDPGTIAATLVRVKSDAQLARHLARNGRLRVEQKFTIGHVIEATLQSYARALDG